MLRLKFKKLKDMEKEKEKIKGDIQKEFEEE